MKLLAIDPGGSVAGYAFFVADELTVVGLSRSKAKGWGARAADGRVGYFQGKTKKGEALVLVAEVVAVAAKDVKPVKAP